MAQRAVSNLAWGGVHDERDVAVSRTIYVTLLVLTPAQPCFAQAAKPLDPRLGALMGFEREIDVAAAR